MVRLRRGGHRPSREWSAAAHRQSKKNSQKPKKGLKRDTSKRSFTIDHKECIAMTMSGMIDGRARVLLLSNSSIRVWTVTDIEPPLRSCVDIIWMSTIEVGSPPVTTTWTLTTKHMRDERRSSGVFSLY